MKILIIEDEQAAVRRLQKLIGEIDKQAEILGALCSIELAVEWLTGHPPPDVIFMDIHLADGSSFDIFNRVDIQAPVIFVTAYDEYALKAFKVNAIDYLLKPIKQHDLENALKKVVSAPGLKEEGEGLFQKLSDAGLIKPSKRILVRMGQALKLIELNQVAYFYSRDKISFAVLPENKRYPLDQSLDQLEHMVDATQFFRINRQFIINLKSIDEMIAYSKSRVKLKLVPHSEEDAIVSKERSPEFKRWLVGGEE